MDIPKWIYPNGLSSHTPIFTIYFESQSAVSLTAAEKKVFSSTSKKVVPFVRLPKTTYYYLLYRARLIRAFYTRSIFHCTKKNHTQNINIKQWLPKELTLQSHFHYHLQP